MDVISVIVPVYNTEAYLDKCVQSLVDQTHRELEILLVDDGSPDHSGALCDEWAKKDSRIRVIHKKNGGQGDARNVGLDTATGDYVAFVDSDDFVHPRFLEWLYQAIQIHKADLAACEMAFFENDRDIVMAENEPPMQRYTTEEALATILRGRTFRAGPCNKLYHRHLLEGERFPVGTYYEDEYFSYKVLAKAERPVFVDAELYYYLQRQGSTMHPTVVTKKRVLDAMEAGYSRLGFLKEYFPNLYKKDKVVFCVGCVNFYQMAFKVDRSERGEALKTIKQYRKNVSVPADEWRRCSVNEKVYIVGGRVCMDLFCRLLILKGRLS